MLLWLQVFGIMREGLEKPKQTFPTIATKQKAALLFIQKGNWLVPRIPYAILKLMNTTPRDFSREEHQKTKTKKSKQTKPPKPERTGREKPSETDLKVEGRWGKEKGNMQSHRVWPEWTKNFFEYGNLQKLKSIQLGEWKKKAKATYSLFTHVERKQGLVSQSDSVTLRTNQWPFLGFHFQSSNEMWFPNYAQILSH